ncbi:MAG: sigma-70 family RNA polymerase sigma factor [Lachnospiraceae bacterium]|nr:sigma-70 family RNA polymerase sigma factor [Lachnospiraceae bacterium]
MSFRKITVKSGDKESTLEVTEEEYLKYYRPWWQQKKKEQRNREAMEQNGYTEESYEEWKENDMRTELFAESMEELAEKRMLLGVLQDAMDSLLPEERELAMKVFGEEMPLADYADMKKQNPRTLSDHKRKVLSKLRKFFSEHGFEIDSR